MRFQEEQSKREKTSDESGSKDASLFSLKKAFDVAEGEDPLIAFGKRRFFLHGMMSPQLLDVFHITSIPEKLGRSCEMNRFHSVIGFAAT